ncbi:hypothetical protein MMC19_005397, partial [Ptychographa xylographoides]|nr:hypothetical protein [Ptychographa xylographoides]
MLVQRSISLGIFTQLSTAALVPRQIAYAGNYAIVNCGPDNTALLHTLLDEIYTALLPAIQDAETTHGPAFQAFFKDAENGAKVSNLLVNITEGAPAFPPDTQFPNGAPLLVCLSGKGELSGRISTGEPFDAFDRCNASIAALSLTGTKYIAICPLFWTTPALVTSPPAPPANNQPASDCLSLSRNKRQFRGTTTNRHGAVKLVQYKVWVVLEEIVHSYIYAAFGLGSHTNPLDLYDSNAALALSAQDSLLNAPSYVLYVASIYGHCTSFPSSTGRELLDAGPDIAANQPTNETDLVSVEPSV